MKKKIFSDVALNIIASLIPMFVLQFVILPSVSNELSSEKYGQLISIVALINLSAGTLGSVLNNSKLINLKKYHDSKVNGDYTILLIIFSIINFVIMILGLEIIIGGMPWKDILQIILVSFLFLVSSYLYVEFRINLNYKRILIHSLLSMVGYIVGYYLFKVNHNWVLIYLIGYLLSLIYDLLKTDLLKQPIIRTKLFNETAKHLIILLISGILISIGAYVDKLIIFPLLGGGAVSIYYTASLLGKTISLVIGPITGVLLSYLAQMNRFSRSHFKTLVGAIFSVGIITFFMIIVLSEPILTILYPQFVKEALSYVPITTLTIIINISSTIINSVILRFYNIWWQIKINMLYVGIYFVVSIILLNLFGLMGFCIGLLMAAVIKFIYMLLIFYKNEITKTI